MTFGRKGKCSVLLKWVQKANCFVYANSFTSIYRVSEQSNLFFKPPSRPSHYYALQLLFVQVFRVVVRIGTGGKGARKSMAPHPIIPTFPFVPLGMNVTGSHFDLIPGCASHLVDVQQRRKFFCDLFLFSVILFLLSRAFNGAAKQPIGGARAPCRFESGPCSNDRNPRRESIPI